MPRIKRKALILIGRHSVNGLHFSPMCQVLPTDFMRKWYANEIWYHQVQGDDIKLRTMVIPKRNSLGWTGNFSATHLCSLEHKEFSANLQGFSKMSNLLKSSPFSIMGSKGGWLNSTGSGYEGICLGTLCGFLLGSQMSTAHRARAWEAGWSLDLRWISEEYRQFCTCKTQECPCLFANSIWLLGLQSNISFV